MSQSKAAGKLGETRISPTKKEILKIVLLLDISDNSIILTSTQKIEISVF